ncbi:MAG TPA: nitric oxide synthase oxygenase [Micromonosporaceae bacterium]|nr:nitric oxide synthase oxygenase [Micromonosporaceae bacterium]
MTTVPGYRDVPTEPWHPDTPVDLAEAEDFLRACYSEMPTLGPVEPRLAIVREQVDAVGTYVHTQAELVHGARMAWRNSSRCIGRLYWRSLVVLDRRTARTPDEIFDHILTHLDVAGGRFRQADAEPAPGRLRPVISIFGQAVPGRPTTRIWNDQLIRYAGYRTEDGPVVGDPKFVDFTEAVTELGWHGKRAAFDVLPLVLEAPGAGPRVYDLPESAVHEVPLTHPEYRWFAELGLRWYAIPAIANMRLSVGGVNYPLAPFSGWYMGTEIGARNLADTDRYDMLPVIGARLGLDMSSDRTLWRDRALVELNRAVLWSFEQAGVRIADHHGESQRFLTHVAKEERAGRKTPADWTWIVPPMSGGLTPVFHRYYHEADQRPNFYLDDEARAYARYGRPPGAHAAGRVAAAEADPPAEVAGARDDVAGTGPAPTAPAPTAPVPATPAPVPAAATIRATAAVPLAAPAALLGQARVSHPAPGGMPEGGPPPGGRHSDVGRHGGPPGHDSQGGHRGPGGNGSYSRNGYQPNGPGVNGHGPNAHGASGHGASGHGANGHGGNGHGGNGPPGEMEATVRLAASPWAAAPEVRSVKPRPPSPIVTPPRVTEPPPPVRPAVPTGTVVLSGGAVPGYPAGQYVLVAAQPSVAGPTAAPAPAATSGATPAQVQAVASDAASDPEPAQGGAPVSGSEPSTAAAGRSGPAVGATNTEATVVRPAAPEPTPEAPAAGDPPGPPERRRWLRTGRRGPS